MSLAGKTALITGGGSGIGAAIAVEFAKRGCRVAICGRRAERLDEVVKSYEGEPPILSHVADVADRQSVEELFGWAGEHLGQIDILVNSAGVNIPKRLMSELIPEHWDLLMQVNATGAYNCMYAVLPQMRERKDGLIINVSSVAGKRAGMLGGVAYNASKFAMTALGSSVSQEEKDHGIRVTSIFPGEVDTPILEDRPTPVTDEHRAKILQPEDVAAAAVMVAELPPRANVPELIIKPTTQAYC
jgi:NADP-dependent 3-hydroxy acid dehydrogenase YdfG